MTARTAPLQASGMLAALPFQFGGQALLPDGVKLSTDRVLASGEAVLVMQPMVTFSGTRDTLRVRVVTDTVAQEAIIAVLSRRSDTVLALPFEGAWTDGAGPSFHTHHRWVVSEEFPHDFVRFGLDGRTFTGSGAAFSDYHAYGQPVLAAAPGRVVTSSMTRGRIQQRCNSLVKPLPPTCRVSCPNRTKGWLKRSTVSLATMSSSRAVDTNMRFMPI